jgi:hypothetical protein
MAYVPFEIEQDLTEVKEFGGEGDLPPSVPPGEYALDIVGLVQDTSKKGNSMIVVDFAVAEGEFAGQQLKGWYTLTDKALGRIKKLQMACGARLDKIRSEEIMGARILATVVHEPGQLQTNPDGTPKADANGVPYAPRIFAKVLNERQLEAVAQQQVPAAAPPVTRKAATQPARRA